MEISKTTIDAVQKLMTSTCKVYFMSENNTADGKIVDYEYLYDSKCNFKKITKNEAMFNNIENEKHVIKLMLPIDIDIEIGYKVVVNDDEYIVKSINDGATKLQTVCECISER